MKNPVDFDLAMAVIEEHRDRTQHDVWAMTSWRNNCDTCMWLLNVVKRLREAEETINAGPA